MKKNGLSFNTRKALANKLGDAAGQEVADLISHLVARIEQLERNKVDITPVVSSANAASVRIGVAESLSF
jgi:hypothetical protein